MKDKRILYYFISGILLILFVFPFIYITKYTFLTADDFCRASLTSKNYFTIVSDWYLYLNGRFFNAIITSVPIFGHFWYRVMLYLQFFLLGVILFSFLKTIFTSYELPNKNYTSLFLTSLFLIVIIAGAPSLYELFYWYSAVTVYLVSFMLFVIFFRFIIKEHFNQSNYILIAFIIISLNGNNELFIGITNFLLLVILVKKYVQENTLNISILLLNLVSWISSIAVIFAPGTLARQGHFSHGGNLLGSIKVAVFYGAKFILESFLNFPYILFYIFLFLFVYRIYRPSNINKYLHPLYLMVVSYLSLASVFFILYYASGLFNVREGKIGNLAGMVTFIFIAVNVLNFAVFLRSKKNYKIFESRLLAVITLLLFLIIVLIKNKNYVALQNDFANNNFEIYNQEVLQRINFLKTTENERIILEPIEGTGIMNSGDGAFNAYDQLLICYKEYINQNYNAGIKDINIKKSQ